MRKRIRLSWLAAVTLLLALLVQPSVPTRAAVGFRISGRYLLDANGNNFIMRGVSHPHVWYPNETSSFANIKAAGANTVRVVLGGGRWGPSSASDVANVINLCKTNRLICLLENHDTTGYGEDGAARSLAQAVAYWQSIQSVLTGQEAYVIINIGNEPYGNNNTTGWIADTRNAIIAMRNAGFQHTLMVDAPNWGQDWQFIMRDNAPSILASDTQGNTIFSIHMYGVFDTAAEVESYVSSFVSRNLPLVIGEFGWNHSDGNPDEDAIMATAQANGIGYIGWSWSGNGGGVEYLDMVMAFNPSQRTSWGTRIITGANGLQQTSQEASIYGGPTPTFTRTPTGPTPTASRTATRSNTPTITPTPSGVLRIQLAAAGSDNNQQSAFHLKVQNTGASALSGITTRVYFTLDGSNAASNYVLEKYYDQSGAATVTGPTLHSGSTYYFTINYGSTALAGGNSWEFHSALHLANWASTYNGSNDWWHTAGTLPASFTNWPSLPAYINGVLAWGGQPGDGPTSTPSQTSTRTPTRSNTPTGVTSTPSRTPTLSNTPTGVTATPSRTPTRSSTATVVTPTFTPTPTQPDGGTCSPVNATITAPFVQDGSGTFCWRTTNLGSYINSWNLTSLKVNGVDYTNKYASTGSLPAKIDGYWYIVYVGDYPWSHFEAK